MLRIVRSLLEPNSRPRKPTIPSVKALNLSLSFSHQLTSSLASVLMAFYPGPKSGKIKGFPKYQSKEAFQGGQYGPLGSFGTGHWSLDPRQIPFTKDLGWASIIR